MSIYGNIEKVSGGRVLLTGTATVTPGYTLTVTIELQRMQAGSWRYVDSWTAKQQSQFFCGLEVYHSISAGEILRNKVTATVHYNGTFIEQVTIFTGHVTG